ncbi:ABC transporter substrate-binding protein [Mesorhizobium sp. RP14(2022)]|uniref:ABC transporter substrate-binding protein n=1 Tax=Mesorhizobium liriopis TaxID=2953882 RepID=A0ABT1C6C1_9HYPH|nr:ABC transporter substrate-binding protein [Mesorhizobium liriopis]MCO6050367.1 ABC transporter substrate-binding protein [Mesorhizobium liriopis]
MFKFAKPRALPSLFHGLAVSLVLGVSAAGAWAQERVVFGTPGALSDNSLAVKIAIDKGFYKEAGIDAEIVNFKGGAPSIQALVGGGIQYAIAAPEHVIRLKTRGVDAAVAFALQGTHTYALLVPEASPVKSFADLKGKRVGITSAGSLTENLIRLEAHENGLAVGSDIEVLGAGVGAAQKAALDTGRIDAGMFGNLDAIRLSGQGYRIVYDWRTQEIPGLALLALDSYVKENPKIAQAVAEATLKAQKLVIEDRATTVAALKEIYPDLSDEIAGKVAEGLSRSLVASGRFSEASYARLQKDLAVIDPDLTTVDFATANPGTYLN